jgi:hypothetical protein
MAHRIREAMKDGGLAVLGGPDGSGIVEADETYDGPIANDKIRTKTTTVAPSLRADVPARPTSGLSWRLLNEARIRSSSETGEPQDQND